MASDDKPTYLDFWPLVAKAWTRLGVRPTLGLVGDQVAADGSLGDVVRLAPIPGVDSGLHAQAVRLLLPTLFPDEVCLISDIDMLPLCAHYFTDPLAAIEASRFVVYRDKAYGPEVRRYPMCYNAATGRTYAELFGVHSPDQIEPTLKDWAGRGWGWFTDELVLHEQLERWADRRVLLGHGVVRRIDRSDWRYSPQAVRAHMYVDSHLLRPYTQHRDAIDRLAALAGRDSHPSLALRAVGRAAYGGWTLATRLRREAGRRRRALMAALLTRRPATKS